MGLKNIDLHLGHFKTIPSSFKNVLKQAIVVLNRSFCWKEQKSSPGKIYDRVEKTNKSELLTRLTYTGLIYILEVGPKTFRLNCQFLRPRSPKNWHQKLKNGLIFFWGWRLIFFGFKTFPEMSLNFCKSRISW